MACYQHSNKKAVLWAFESFLHISLSRSLRENPKNDSPKWKWKQKKNFSHSWKIFDLKFACKVNKTTEVNNEKKIFACEAGFNEHKSVGCKNIIKEEEEKVGKILFYLYW